MIIIGITGTLGAGKGEIVNCLKAKGFIHYSAREFLIAELRKRNLPVNRDMTTMIANEFREKYSPGYIIESLYNQAKKVGNNAVIESIRALGEIEFLKKQDNFTLISIDADPKIRYARIKGRKSDLDRVSYEKFLFDEEREMHSADPSKGNIEGVMRQADFSIVNNGTKEELHKIIENILNNIQPK